MAPFPASSLIQIDATSALPERRQSYARQAALLVPRIVAGEFTVSFVELERLHRDIVDGFGDEDHLTERVDTLNGISTHAIVCGRAMAGIEFAVDGLRLARKLAQPLRLMRALNVLGYCLSDTVDIAGAIEFFGEALRLAIDTGNSQAEAHLWSGLGCALELAGQHDDARKSLVRATQVAGTNDLVRAAALTNLAWSCLHTSDVETGLHYAYGAIAANPDPRTPSLLLNRVLAEVHCARLLLLRHEPAEAHEHVAIAKDLAARGNSERGLLSAAVAEALCEVTRGQSDVGVSRLERLLERARTMRSALQDVLLALVSAYRTIGQPERAQAHLRELAHVARLGQKEYLRSAVPALSQLRAGLASDAQSSPAARGAASEAGRNADLWRDMGTMGTPTTIEMLERLALQANWVDDPLGLHMYRVGRLSALLASEYGLEPDVSRAMEIAGRLHDIGKYSLTFARQRHRSGVDALAAERLRMHAEDGATLLSHAQVPGTQFAEDVALHHHERFDGLGYPNRLRGAGIPFAARIVAIANAFDSLAWPTGGRVGMPLDRAIDEIAAGRSTRFDPQLTDLFVALIQKLRKTEPNLRAALEQSATSSNFLAARRQITELLETEPKAGASAELSATLDAAQLLSRSERDSGEKRATGD